MDMERHYDEDTISILIGGGDAGITPQANSLPYHKCFVGKKHSKLLKNLLKDLNDKVEEDVTIEECMNIAFTQDPDFLGGELYEWSLFDDIKNIMIIDKTRLYVKGLYFWVYAVGVLKCLE
jgi:hypothetical protein